MFLTNYSNKNRLRSKEQIADILKRNYFLFAKMSLNEILEKYSYYELIEHFRKMRSK